MKKFIGKVNGVEYTNEADFNKAVLEAMKSGEYSVSSEYIEDNRDEQSEKKVLERDENGRFVKKEKKPAIDLSDVEITDATVDEYEKESDYFGFRTAATARLNKVLGRVSTRDEFGQLSTLAGEYTKQTDNKIDEVSAKQKELTDKIEELGKEYLKLKGEHAKLSAHKSYLKVLKNYYQTLTHPELRNRNSILNNSFEKNINDLSNLVQKWFS